MLNLRQDDYRGKILNTVFDRVWWKDRHPLHAANTLALKGCWKTINSLLSVVVKDLHNLFWKKHIAFVKRPKRTLGSSHRHMNVQAAGSEEIFLRKEMAMNVMVGHR